MTPESILEALDDEQQAVAAAVHGPVVVLAGAGTGKTRAITHRIAYAAATGAHEPRRTLAVTFTTRAAGEMRSRLRELGVEGVGIRTFHAAALRQLRYFWPRLSSNEFPQLLPSKARLVAEAAASCGLSTDQALVRDLASDIEWSKVHELEASDLGRDPKSFIRTWSMDVGDVSRTYAAYDDLKARRGYLDFEDVLLVTVGALRSRPDILDEVHQNYRWFTVDEYQDINPVQHRLLNLWRGDRDDVCVVGDVSQNIYSFTGASPDFLINFRKEFKDASQIELVNCYRCAEPIVAAANAVIAQASTPASLQLRAVRAGGVKPVVKAYDDDVDEATSVAEEIADLIAKGTSAKDIAVLFRVNAQSAELESALTERGVPIMLRGVERFFDRAEVREGVTRLRGAARAGGSAGALGDEVRAVLGAAGWADTPPKGGGAVRERWESLSALVALADEHAELDLSAFIGELDRRAENQHAPVADAVTLASLHSAKGLEWSAVFIVGCSEGLLPLQYAETDEAIEEERRLFYVGVTRAKDLLQCSWAKARQPGGRSSRQPSPFLRAFSASGSAAGASARVQLGSNKPRNERVRKGPAKCRVCNKALVTAQERTLGHCHTCPVDRDEHTFGALRQWRLLLSREREVPAYVICTDATLLAIAEQKPDSLDELAEIPGIGPAKLAEFGEDILGVIKAQKLQNPV
ncbi:MAG: ATP-dependent DNA helicase UvrD2 [Candidatus Nanopelagicales bacterium]|nr:ATP-dependent DNA helicase UvrD2 [Candidatus Nanopelagicales bacterium]